MKKINLILFGLIFGLIFYLGWRGSSLWNSIFTSTNPLTSFFSWLSAFLGFKEYPTIDPDTPESGGGFGAGGGGSW